jgi:hypothetical protein
MQTSRRTWLIGLIVGSLMVPAGALMAQAPANPAPAPKAKLAPPADPTAVLKVIPAEATAFVAVRNLAEVDADVSAVAQKLGFPLENMGFPGLLGMIREHAGIEQGLNANSGAAVALLNCSQVKATNELSKRAVFLLPSDNVEALTKSLGGKKEGETIQLTLGGEPAVAAAKEGFLIVAQNPETLREAMKASGGILKTISPDRLKAYAGQDVFAWANPRGISKEVRDDVMTTIRGMIALSSAGAGAEKVESSMAELDKFIDGLKEVSLGVTLDPKIGLKFTFYYRALPDSELAKDVAGMKPSGTPLLAGLPDEAIIAAFGASGGAGNTAREKQFRTALDQALNPGVLGAEVDVAQLNSVKDSAAKLFSSFEQFSASIAGLPGESQDGMVAVTMVAKVTNSQKAQAEIRKLFNSAKDLILKTALANGQITEEEAKTAKEAIQLKENAEKLTGAVVDHFVVDLSKFPEADEETMSQIKGLVGQEGILVRIAAVGDKNLAVTFGGGAKRFAQVVDQVKNGQAPLNERKTIKMIADRLPVQNRLMEAYLSVDRLLATVMDVAGKMGQRPPIPLAMKETAPLALVSGKVDETAIEAEALVPIELAQSTAEMVGPMLGMFMGGGMGGMGAPGTTAPGAAEEKEEPAPAPTPAPGVR